MGGGQIGRMPYLTTQMNLSRQIRHTSFRMFARFHTPGMVSFLFWVVSFRYGFLLGFFSQYASASVYLHFRVFQLSASGGHSRSGRKGNSGIGRESKVKPPVSAKNLQPCGSYFSRKTLHSLIPTFSSTRNENDRCDRKTH